MINPVNIVHLQENPFYAINYMWSLQAPVAIG